MDEIQTFLSKDIQYRKVTKCSACGRTHRILFHRLAVPELVQAAVMTHVGVCENTSVDVYAQEQVDASKD
jgi:hypothetical protein